MELCTFCDMRAKELAEYKSGKEPDALAYGWLHEVYPLFEDKEYLEEIEPFEDRFRITKSEMEEFYGIYQQMSAYGKGDFYSTQKIIRAKYPSFHKYKAIDAFIYLFLAGRVEDLNKLYANVGSPSEFKDELIGGERSSIDLRECREFVLAKLEKEIMRRV